MMNRRLGEFKWKCFLATLLLLFALAFWVFSRFSFQTVVPEATDKREIQVLSDRIAALESEIRRVNSELTNVQGRLETLNTSIKQPKPTANKQSKTKSK